MNGLPDPITLTPPPTGEYVSLLNPKTKESIIPLPCSCGDCRRTYATIEQGGLWIQAAHDPHHKMRVPDVLILKLAAMILLRQLGGV